MHTTAARVTGDSTMTSAFAQRKVDRGGSVFHPMPTTLLPATDGSGDLTDLRIGANCPALFFAIPLEEEALVTISFQELNSASRCALFLSPCDPHPSEETAVWRLTSPEPVKSLVIHPADGNYTSSSESGFLYLAVRYLEGNGSTFVNLGVRLQPAFYGVWFHREVRRGDGATTGSVARQDTTADCLSTSSGASRAAVTTPSRSSPGDEESYYSRGDATSVAAAADVEGVLWVSSSLYIGSWLGRRHHGRGVCFYASAPAVVAAEGTIAASNPSSLLLLQTMFERRSLPWSGLTLPENPTLDGTALDAEFIAKITGLLDPRDAAAEGVSSETPPIARVFHKNDSNDAVVEKEVSRKNGKPEKSRGGEDDSPATASGGKLVWQVIQTPIYDEGIEAYDGEWVNGRKEGFGVYQWTDRVYVGEWLEGKRHGKGELRCQDGAYYCGEWRNDRRDGHGEAFLVPEENLYKGEWRDGLQEGYGSLRYPNGVVVSGVWVGGALETDANVTAVYPDGTTYVGSWKDAGRHGLGSCTDAKGCVHEHCWADDQRHGNGNIRLRNGVRFEGEWERDAVVMGTYWFPNGDAYQGDWDGVNDGRTGKGTCRAKDGSVYDGEWLHDQRHGQGTMRYANGATYTGAWADDRPDGEGRLEDAEGVYTGAFVRGLRCGVGEQRNPDGSVYVGDWRNNYRAGHGTQYDAKSDITYTGIFLHDRLQGRGDSLKRVGGGKEEVYSGTWLDGLEQGHGTLRLPSGDIMRGVWHRGKQRDGSVEFQAADGGFYVGDWCGGVRCGRGTQVAADGATVYEGDWVDGKPHGRGRLTRVTGESVECDWEKGTMVDGSIGTAEFLDGSVYTGEVRQGIPHGQGSLTYPDSTVFQGSFDNGIYSL